MASSSHSRNSLGHEVLHDQAQRGLHRIPSWNEQEIGPASPRPVLVGKPGSFRLVLAIKFGTRFSGCASALVAGENTKAEPLKISVMKDWTPTMSNLDKVPSVISYSRGYGSKVEWGEDVTDESVTVVNQKMELELQDNKIDELDLTLAVLAGTRQFSFRYIQDAGPEPDFPAKEPEEIVTDYLRQLFECIVVAIDLAQLSATLTPIDLVITSPACWSYEAKNLLFRAVCAAGFNSHNMPTLADTMLVSEPEAAAYFIASHYKDKGEGFLKVGTSFVLCDAGGVTVDAVAFETKQVTPVLELNMITKPTGRRCGSFSIDRAFKEWLRDTLGREKYAALDPFNGRQRSHTAHSGESGPMRQLIRRFSAEKERFSGEDMAEIKLDLPGPLDRLTVAGRVYEGELIIKCEEMRAIMDTCVGEIVSLVLCQIDVAHKTTGSRVKDIFLVGGFGASLYLRTELETKLARLHIRLRCSDSAESHTALLQGAVIYGSESCSLTSPDFIYPIPRSYGYIAYSGSFREFQWLVRKGDMSFSGQRLSDPFWLHPKDSSACTLSFRFFASDDHDDLPMDWDTGRNDVHVVGILRLQSQQESARRGHMIGPFRWALTLNHTHHHAKLYLNDQEYGTCRFVAEGESDSSADRNAPENPYADPEAS